ncbi:MAG: dihydrolipoamide acetyltransferase family protein [Melioribacteraceae bacterium]|jgi:pyruvate/2-oxoglutarate dehydrogenase complex dihydrolipoamide acyltransferase (E2) component|nr:dihydrolipoamide acetyltransferase family protein [Melioribacteraceae bacterium]
MKIDVVMPKMGESLTEGTIIAWLKSVGDKVQKDEIIYEITTDKVDTEIPSPVDGILIDIKVKEHETVNVDTVVAIIETDASQAVIVENSDKTVTKPQESEVIKDEEKTAVIQQVERKEKSISNKFFSPLVMNIANKENISFDELESISGTGANGRVSKKDILNFISNKGKTSVPSKPVQSSVVINSEDEIIPMDTTRKRIMEHMIKSRDTSVHVSSVTEVDMSKIYNFMKFNKKRFLEEEKIKFTYMTFISHAVINSIKEFPLINSQIDGENIIVKKYVNLGIAVAVEPNGLIVPNIKHAENLSARGLAKEIASLGNKARTKGLKPDDVKNGTFSITNYGVFGLQFGTPIINQPEVAILGVGSVDKKAVVIEVDGLDTIAIKPMMYLTISHDHRLIDGMLGGKFLNSVKQRLQNFDFSNI